MSRTPYRQTHQYTALLFTDNLFDFRLIIAAIKFAHILLSTIG